MPIRDPFIVTQNLAPSLLKRAGLLVSAGLSFLVLGLTNDRIVSFLESRGWLYVNGDTGPAKSVRFFVDPLKSLLFFAGTSVLLWGVLPSVWRAVRRLTSRDIREAAGSFALCTALIATLVPTSYGRFYARISTAPFDQVPGDMYRRLLMPGLAYIWHLDGFLYIFLFWAVVFVALLLLKSLLRKSDLELSVLDGASLLTTGVFMTAFETPGYPEIAVLLLALAAWNAQEDSDDAELVVLSGFALALMAHEASAIIIFAPLLLFHYRPRVWGWASFIALLYLFCVGAEFSFNLSIPARMQTTVSAVPAPAYFTRNPGRVAIAALSAFKLLWLVIAVGVASVWRDHRREAGFVLTGLTLAIASTFLAVDYTRMVALATLPMLACLMHARMIVPRRILKAIFAVNLLCPSLMIYGNAARPAAGRGGYWLLCKILRILVEHF